MTPRELSEHARTALDLAVDIDPEDVDAIAEEVTWPEVHAHGPTSTCGCPAFATIAGLIALGYHIHKAADRPGDPHEILHALNHRLNGEVPVEDGD